MRRRTVAQGFGRKRRGKEAWSDAFRGIISAVSRRAVPAWFGGSARFSPSTDNRHRTIHVYADNRETVWKPFRMFWLRSCRTRGRAGAHASKPRDVPRSGYYTRRCVSPGHASPRLERPQAQRASACLRLRPAIFIPLKQPVPSASRYARVIVGRWVMEDPSIHPFCR